jgi:hypothetical protein
VGETISQIADAAAALGLRKHLLEIHRRLAQDLGAPQSHRDVSVSLNLLIWTTRLTIETVLPKDPAAAARSITFSRAWVEAFEPA